MEDYLKPYWTGHETIEAYDAAEASRIASELCRRPVTLTDADMLPYPAAPKRGPHSSGMPTFCHRPNECKGLGRCSSRYSCVD